MYNKVILIGNLTRDIELKYIPSGAAIAKGAIATSHKYKAQDGSQKEEVCFLDFNVFGKAAEVLNQYVKKGSKVMLEGRLVLESWTAQDGSSRNRHSLRVEEFKFLDSKSSDNNSSDYQPKQVEQYNKPSYSNTQQGGTREPAYQVPEINIDIDDDEIPF
jgi:single-strand DNA-binding protein